MPSKIYNVVILEDDFVQRKLMEAWVALLPELHLAGSFETVRECLAYFHQNDADVLLLDVNLPDLNGITMFKSLKNPPVVVLQTLESGSAVDGFEIGAADFLLKPYTFDRFALAIRRALEGRASLIGKGDSFEKKPDSSPSILVEGESEAFILVKSAQEQRKVYLKNLVFIEALQNYSKLRLSNDDVIVSPIGIKHLQEQLPCPPFARIHKSYVVNLSFVRSFGKRNLVAAGHSLSVGALYYKEAYQLWESEE